MNRKIRLGVKGQEKHLKQEFYQKSSENLLYTQIKYSGSKMAIVMMTLFLEIILNYLATVSFGFSIAMWFVVVDDELDTHLTTWQTRSLKVGNISIM